jgi:sarcosine oxidase subunit gamma
MAESAQRQAPAVTAPAWLKMLPPATRLVFQGPRAARDVAAVAFGVPFAEEACRARIHGGRATLWMGPDEYLLLDTATPVSPPVEAPPAFVAIQAALGTLPGSLVDISHRQVAFELTGPAAAAILNTGCPLDLDLAHFPPGMCTRTLYAKADILLWRTGTDSFHVEVWRSFSEYLVSLLTEVARDIVP